MNDAVHSLILNCSINFLSSTANSARLKLEREISSIEDVCCWVAAETYSVAAEFSSAMAERFSNDETISSLIAAICFQCHLKNPRRDLMQPSPFQFVHI